MTPSLRIALLGLLVLLAAVSCGTDPATEKLADTRQIDTVSDSRRALIRKMAIGVHVVQTIRCLNTRAVQKQLGLSPEQLEAVERIRTEARETLERLRLLAEDCPPLKLFSSWLPTARSLKLRIKQSLTTKQRSRLVQIVLQKQLGATVLLIPHVVEQLKLTDQQQRSIEDIAAETVAAFERYGTSLLGLIQLVPVAQAARERAMAVLSTEQRKAWTSLLGEPI